MLNQLNSKEKSVLDAVCRDESVAMYFFREAKKIKWYDSLEQKGFFKAEGIPEPETHSDHSWSVERWMVLPYLLECAKRVKEDSEGLHKYGEKLIQLICSITQEVTGTEKFKNYMVGWCFVEILQELPIKFFSIEVADAIRAWVKNTPMSATNMVHDIAMLLIPKTLEAGKLKIASIFYEIILKDCLQKEASHNIETEWIKNFFLKYSDLAAKNNPELVKKFIDETVEIRLGEKINDGPNESLFAIEERGIHGYNFFELIFLIMKTFLLAVYNYDKGIFENFVIDYLGHKYSFLNKLGLYMLVQVPSDVNRLFFLAMEKQEDVIKRAFSSLYNEAELGKVLQVIQPLTQDQQAKMKCYIGRGSQFAEYEKDEWKERRYGAFLKDGKFKQEYEQCKDMVGHDSHLHALVTMSVAHCGNKSPFSVDDILAMDNNILIGELMHFKSVAGWDMPTEQGLGACLQIAVRKNPKKFFDDMNPFLKVNHLYVYEMLVGFRECTSEVSLNWDSLLNFIREYIEKKDFWKKEKAVQGIGIWTGGVKAVITAAVYLLSTGCTNKEKYLTPTTLLLKVEKILATVFLHRKEFEHIEQSAFDYVFNNLNGMVLRTLVEAMIYSKKKYDVSTPAWEILDAAFQEDMQEIYALFGYYLPQFYFLNKKWSQQKIKGLSDHMGSPEWITFMAGYYSQAQGYQEIINDLSDFYKKSLNVTLPGVEKKVINCHVAMLYVYDLIKDNGAAALFFDYVDQENEMGLLNIVDYMLDVKEVSQSAEIVNRILKFWKYINEKSDMSGKVLYKAIGFVKYKTEIDKQTFLWLKNAAQYSSSECGGLYWLSKIFRLILDGNGSLLFINIEYVTEIFYEAVKGRSNLFFDAKEWREIMQKLVECSRNELDNMDKLKDINNICLKAGQDLFKNIVY
jgi:hypothetical protein